ncbi:MAG: hypothetical protein PHD70_07190 [Anaerostipes sp.]|nr:hypothetical protein [Anaerostipes sp.]
MGKLDNPYSLFKKCSKILQIDKEGDKDFSYLEVQASIDIYPEYMEQFENVKS